MKGIDFFTSYPQIVASTADTLRTSLVPGQEMTLVFCPRDAKDLSISGLVSDLEIAQCVDFELLILLKAVMMVEVDDGNWGAPMDGVV